ncbi:MAG: amidohydrolase family protein [Candidatus Altiarchaeales archaeon]|nr:amidohydrolase family protein [Candidatus Altiarchaeales archaeon]
MVGGKKLLITNAFDPLKNKQIDLAVSDGFIVSADESTDPDETLDAEGRMVFPGFVNIHTHLDKADLLYQMRPSDFGKSLEENRMLLRRFKKQYSTESLKSRAKKAALEMLENGVTAVRSQVDVDSTGGLTALKALKQLKQELGKQLNLSLCAFPQQGVLDPASRDLLDESLSFGADLLGGLPAVEGAVANQKKHVDALFELALKYDVDLEVQVDESNDPRHFILPYLAEKTIENNMQGRVSATHAISLSAQSPQVAGETIKLLKKAGVNVIVTPGPNLVTRFNLPGGVHSRPSNSITLVKELLAGGVNVALGTDNIRDIFYPIGNASILRELYALAVSTRMTGQQDGLKLLEIASINGAKIMGLNYGLEPGCVADLILLEARHPRDLLNTKSLIPYVIKGGDVVSRIHVERWVA